MYKTKAQSGDKVNYYLACATRTRETPTCGECDDRKTIREDKIQEWYDFKLRQMIEEDDPSYFLNDLVTERTTLQQDLVDLANGIKRAEDEISKLILREIDADPIEQPLIVRLRVSALERLKSMAARQKTLMAQLPSPFDPKAQRDSFEQIRDSIDTFWDRPDIEINALLFQLMGYRRLVVRQGEIVGSADAPKRSRSRKRS